ncbi:MAG: outer membrane beta-barrel protein [Deltaproteobacteria bacterium]|nr:outer membrane beta-barrel protein [Deltaproteobacteria bacterium]
MKTSKIGVKLLIVLMIISLTCMAPQPARAINAADAAAAAAWTTFGVTSFLAFSYLAWKNRPANQDRVDWSPKGPGGFFFGGYMGASFVHSDDWKFNNLAFPGGGAGETTFSTIKFSPSVVGGLKLGYYSHTLPWLGVEVESSFNRQDIRQAAGTLSRPVGAPASDRADVAAARLYVWTMAFHFLGRYGFLPDKEVPFGRLQPYVGIGPGFVILYSWRDAAKNFSLDAEAGVRYMLLRNLSAFVEYKFSQQWEVELEDQRVVSQGLGREGAGTAMFDFTNHKVVVGVTFHFL